LRTLSTSLGCTPSFPFTRSYSHALAVSIWYCFKSLCPSTISAEAFYLLWIFNSPRTPCFSLYFSRVRGSLRVNSFHMAHPRFSYFFQSGSPVKCGYSPPVYAWFAFPPSLRYSFCLDRFINIYADLSLSSRWCFFYPIPHQKSPSTSSLWAQSRPEVLTSLKAIAWVPPPCCSWWGTPLSLGSRVLLTYLLLIGIPFLYHFPFPTASVVSLPIFPSLIVLFVVSKLLSSCVSRSAAPVLGFCFPPSTCWIFRCSFFFSPSRSSIGSLFFHYMVPFLNLYGPFVLVISNCVCFGSYSPGTLPDPLVSHYTISLFHNCSARVKRVPPPFIVQLPGQPTLVDGWVCLFFFPFFLGSFFCPFLSYCYACVNSFSIFCFLFPSIHPDLPAPCILSWTARLATKSTPTRQILFFHRLFLWPTSHFNCLLLKSFPLLLRSLPCLTEELFAVILSTPQFFYPLSAYVFATFPPSQFPFCILRPCRVLSSLRTLHSFQDSCCWKLSDHVATGSLHKVFFLIISFLLFSNYISSLFYTTSISCTLFPPLLLLDDLFLAVPWLPFFFSMISFYYATYFFFFFFLSPSVFSELVPVCSSFFVLLYIFPIILVRHPSSKCILSSSLSLACSELPWCLVCLRATFYCHIHTSLKTASVRSILSPLCIFLFLVSPFFFYVPHNPSLLPSPFVGFLFYFPLR